MNKLLGIAAAAVVLSCAGRSAAQSATVGQLLNVNGRVEVQRGRQPAMKGTLLFQLQKGDVVAVRDGASAEVVLFASGARFALPAGVSARVEPSELKSLSGPRPRALPGLSKSFARRMNTPARPVSPKILGVLVRGGDDATLGPRRPAPNGAVRTVPVVLKWSGPIEGDQLRLQINDGERTVHRAMLPPTAREHSIPAGVLHPGDYYVWTVTAFQGGDAGQRCRGLLRVLTPEERAEVADMEKETAATIAATPDNPAPLLLLAQAYERLGMYDDAAGAYQRVLKLRPDDDGVQAALKRLSAGD